MTEFNDKIGIDEALNFEQLCQLYSQRGVTLEDFRWKFDQELATMKPATVRVFFGMCPKLASITGVIPNGPMQVLLAKTFGPMAASALAQVTDKQATVCTENIMSIVMMGAQVKKLDVQFLGGPVPRLTMSMMPTQSLPTPPVLSVKVVSGVPSFDVKVCGSLLAIGMKVSTPVSPLTATACAQIAVTHRPTTDTLLLPHPIIPGKVEVPGFKDGRIGTAFGNLIAKGFRHAPCSVLTLISDTAQNCERMDRWFDKYKGRELGIEDKLVLKVPTLGGRNFCDLEIDVLKDYHKKGYDQFGKAKFFIKNTDIGYPGLNAPLKWKLPIELITGSPDDKGFKPTLKCSYWGAGGNRARAMFERRGIITAYDLKASPAPTKKVSAEDMKRLKIYEWKVKDIYSHRDFAGDDVFISDIYMLKWKTQGSDDLNGHRFVSGILRGRIESGDNVTCSSLPRVRIIKGFLPSLLESRIYDEVIHPESKEVLVPTCFPFVAFRVCRPITTEVIYLKLDESIAKEEAEAVYKNIPILVENSKAFGRIHLISNLDQFQRFVKMCYICCCEEVNFQQRRLAADPRKVYASAHNRLWGLRVDDLPCLFVPKGMRGVGVNAIDANSALFGMAVEGETIGEDDVFQLMSELDTSGQTANEYPIASTTASKVEFDDIFDLSAPGGVSPGGGASVLALDPENL